MNYTSELERLIKLGEDHYRAICPLKKDGQEHPRNCICNRMGNIWAFRETFIKEGYRNFTLENFTGKTRKKNRDEQLLSEEVVVKAKQGFIRYCFKGIAEDEMGDYNEIKWSDKSIMADRREQGHSLVIYGNPYRMISLPPSSSSYGKVETKYVKKPIGKTMLACLALREAINLRWKPGHDGDTYCFVQYSHLVQHLMAQASGDKSFEDKINLYKDCDWLVVDEICRGTKDSEAAKRFKANVLNSLFGERLASGLPNILVFEEDLIKIIDELDQEFGSSLTDIIRNKKTHKIALI